MSVEQLAETSTCLTVDSWFCDSHEPINIGTDVIVIIGELFGSVIFVEFIKVYRPHLSLLNSWFYEVGESMEIGTGFIEVAGELWIV